MRFFYNVAFLVFSVIYFPTFLVKIRQADNKKRLIKERFGIFAHTWREKFLGRKIVWIHAVSVGEVLAVQRFVQELLDHSPEYSVVLTTVTATGQKLAKKLECERVTVCYFPFDLTGPVRNFFKTLGPECLLLVETEIWPNLLTEARKFRVPVGILNARLSAKSADRYKRFRFIFKALFETLEFVLVQTHQDAQRFETLGVDPARIQILGNMKFDNISAVDVNGPPPRVLREEWGFSGDDRILIAGSTHPGEEEILAQVGRDLQSHDPQFKLLVAPRHIERADKLAILFQKEGFRVRLATEAKSDKGYDVLILNQLGVLKHLYAIADAVFMGGSLVRHGGQNPIEPAQFKRPILHGPYVFNFEEIYQILNREGGALLIRDEHQFLFALKRIFQNTAESQKLGERAYAIVERCRGATQRHIQWLLKFLDAKTQAERINHVQVHENVFSPAR